MLNHSRHNQIFASTESTHRRTYSNNIESLKGIKAGHRRTMSNTAFDFASIKIQSPPPVCIEEAPAQLTPKTSVKKKKGFLSLIKAAISYFKQEAKFPIVFPPSEVDSLKEQLETLNIKHSELEEGNSKLLSECEKYKILLENHSKTKKNLDGMIGELKKNSQSLESSFKKIQADIKAELKRGEDLVFFIGNEKIRSSPQNMFIEEGDRKLKRKQSDTDKPTPKPITYKPLTQRGLRNSRDTFKK